MGLTNEGELDMLRVYFKGAEPPSGFYLGLAYDSSIDDSATLEDINEVADDNYQRQAITFSDPAIDADGNSVIVNANAIEFGPFSENLPDTIRSAFITDAPSGTEGKLIIAGPIENAWQPPRGGIVRFPPGNLRFRIE